jgi:hypothetical protein
MSSIRSILEDLVLNVIEANSRQGGDGDMDKRNYAYDQALKDISDAIKREVIGEDELVIKTDDIQEIDLSMNNAEVRNELRYDQRNRSKELFK